MKVSLVVASGAHQGKVIPITGPQFLIGRDAQCHLRPASQAISKQHCGVLVRDGQIYVKDFGSTNGTLVNDALIRAAEVMVTNGASLKLGPLDFIIHIEVSAPKPDGTPLPGATPGAAAALAAVKAAAGANVKAPLRDATPNPVLPNKPVKAAPSKEGSKEAAALIASKEAAALKSAPKSAEIKLPKSAEIKLPARPESAPAASLATPGADNEDDKMAALLLGMEDDNQTVPEGSTVVELPAVDAKGQPIPAGGEEKGEDKKKPAQSREDMTNAASDLLRKMMRRPK